MNYCPECGGRLAERFVPAEGRPRLVCQACGEVFYQNPKVVAATITHRDGQVFLLRRGVPPGWGLWGLPAGYVEIGETVEDAARRETREEIGLEVEIQRLFNVYSRPGSPIVNIVYLARVIGGELRAGGEALAVGAFLPEEIPWGELAFPSHVAALREWAQLQAAGGPPRPSG